jgi:hypothetical protein
VSTLRTNNGLDAVLGPILGGPDRGVSLYTAAEPFMPDTVVSDTDYAATDTSCDSQPPSASDDSS